jgi:hypothetical protein
MPSRSIQHLEHLVELHFLPFEKVISNPVAHDLHTPLLWGLELGIVILKDLLPEK